MSINMTQLITQKINLEPKNTQKIIDLIIYLFQKDNDFLYAKEVVGRVDNNKVIISNILIKHE